MSSTNRRTRFLIACAAGWLAAVPAGHAFDLQGHRGARGLMPENTLAGFAAAVRAAMQAAGLPLPPQVMPGEAGRPPDTSSQTRRSLSR